MFLGITVASVLSYLKAAGIGAAFGAGKAAINIAKPTQSLSKMARNLRVEPLAIIDEKTLLSPDVLNNSLSASLDIFIATYLQLFLSNRGGVDVGSIQIINQGKPLTGIDLKYDKLHKNAHAGKFSFEDLNGLPISENLASDIVLLDLEETYKYSLLATDEEKWDREDQVRYETWQRDDAIRADREAREDSQRTTDFNRREDSLKAADNRKMGMDVINRSRDAYSSVVKDINTDPNLVVGRIVELESHAGGSRVLLPVPFRLISNVANNSLLLDALESRFSSNKSALERKWGWKSGRLSLIKDVIFATDAVKAERRRKFKDTDNIYDKLSPNPARNKSAVDLIKGNVSIAEASSVLVLDSETAEEVEYRLGGKLTNQNFRERLLSATGVMVLVIIDRGDDMVTFYYDGLDKGNTVTSSAIEKSRRGNGTDISKVLEQFLASSTPRF